MKYIRYDTYPESFISSIDCCRMTLAEFGLFNWLLMHSWCYSENPCHLPNDPETIVFLLRINREEFDKLWPKVKHKFKFTKDKKFFYNERLLGEYKSCLTRSKTYAANRLGKRKSNEEQ